MKKSRGFGFVRFKKEEDARAAVSIDHYIGGRRVEVKLKKDNPMKMFVGRLPNGTMKEDLMDYFSKYGDVLDTYVPSPFRGFGFVTFASSDVGNYVLRETHVLHGMQLNVSKGEDSKSFNQKRANNTANSDFSNRSRQRIDPDIQLKDKLIAFLQNQR